MFVNGQKLLNLSPIANMETEKLRFEGTSYGLAEAGYDIRINQDVHFGLDGEIIVTDSEGNETFSHGSFTLASAMEEFTMPNNLVGGVKDKSTWARQGLSVFNTVIEPGWNGFLTLELVYHGTNELSIQRGQGIAQVLFGLLAEEGDYGEGKYQNQANKPVEARG